MSVLDLNPRSQSNVDRIIDLMEGCEDSAPQTVRRFLEGSLVPLESLYEDVEGISHAVAKERAENVAMHAAQSTDAIVGATEQYQNAYRESLSRLAQGESPSKVSRDLLAQTLNETMRGMDDAQRVRLLTAYRALQLRIWDGVRAVAGAGDDATLDETVTSASGEAERLASERAEQLLQAVLDDSSFEQLASCDLVCVLAAFVREGASDEELAEGVEDALGDWRYRLFVSAALYVELEMTRPARGSVNPGMVAVTANRLVDESSLAKEIAQGGTSQERGQPPALARERKIMAIANAARVATIAVLALAAVAGQVALPTVMLLSIAEGFDFALIAGIVGAITGLGLAISTFNDVYDLCEGIGEDAGDAAESCARYVVALADRVRGACATAPREAHPARAGASVAATVSPRPMTMGS